MNNRDSDERARELLSSYLDGHCTPAEKAFVEERLAQSQALREELDELRMTVDALHHLPEVPLPRSFYITEAMLEERTPHPLFSWMIPALRGLRVASGAVALSLVSVLLLAVLTQNTVQPAPASAPAPAFAPAPASTPAPEAQKSVPAVGGAQAPQPTRTAASGMSPTVTSQDTGQAPPAAASSTASSSATLTSTNSTMPLAPPTSPTATNREMQPAGAAPRASPTPEPAQVQTYLQPATAEPAHASSGINLWEVAGGLAALLLVLLVAQAIIARRV